MSNKQFVLGVGCQKGGTTWLYEQLNSNSKVNFGFLKEYHLFDAIYTRYGSTDPVDLCKTRRVRVHLANSEKDLTRYFGFFNNHSDYFDYFESLWQPENITTVGDITPTYCALPVEAYQYIRDELISRGFVVKVIFIIRDPVQRCLSMARMRKMARIREKGHSELSEEDFLSLIYSHRGCEDRTRYENTICNLEKVFKPKELFIIPFEYLFTVQGGESLKSFLGIPNLNLSINEPSNATRKDNKPIDLSLCHKVYQHYKTTYDFCASRFPVKELWYGYQFENFRG